MFSPKTVYSQGFDWLSLTTLDLPTPAWPWDCVVRWSDETGQQHGTWSTLVVRGDGGGVWKVGTEALDPVLESKPTQTLLHGLEDVGTAWRLAVCSCLQALALLRLTFTLLAFLALTSARRWSMDQPPSVSRSSDRWYLPIPRFKSTRPPA